MTDTLWSDVSEFNPPVSNAYPYGLLSIRSNDGTYNDHVFAANMAWSRNALATGKLWGLIVYYFYRPGVNGSAVLRARAGVPPRHMAVMIDVESDGGRVSGNQSGQINQEFAELASWLGDPRRVIGYGNTGDLDALWPVRPRGIRLVIAAYGSNPSYPGKFAHQFTDKAITAPFGPSDLNSADGMSPAALQSMLGFTIPSQPWEITLINRMPTLKQGASDGPGRPLHVHTLQALLLKENQHITVDGVFGPQTENAVRAVQAKYHIGADGIVGPQTWAPLFTGATL